MNIVFIGHVDAGKSTIGGQILYLTVRCSTKKASCGCSEAIAFWHALMCCNGRLAALIAKYARDVLLPLALCLQGGVDDRTIQKYER